tara:strand:+ start:4759 stop:5154 length:396 start_codon:yes stop_codon:yes gene_type:complete
MTKEEKNALELLASADGSNQLLGLYGLKSLGWSLDQIATNWSKLIFNNVEYDLPNRIGVTFGIADTLYFCMNEEYKQKWEHNEIKDGGWEVTCEYFLKDNYKSIKVGNFPYGFNPEIISNYFHSYLKKYFI